MIVRRELTYACDVDVRQMDLSTNRGWGQFRQAGPDHFRRVPKCVERGNGGVRLEDVHFRRGNDLFSEDNCDARIKNRIRSSNSRARSGNDPVRIVNNRDAFGNTRLRGGNNDLQDGINHSHSANNCSRRENNHFVSLVDSLLIQWYLMFAANIRFRWELSTFVAETIMLEPRILADVPSISVLQMEMIGSAATAIMDVLPVIISVAENIASLTT